MEHLEEIGGRFNLHVHDRPTDISALTRLPTVGDEFSLSSTDVSDATGLESLRAIGHLRILGNPRLSSLAGLSGLETVGADVAITDNAVLDQADAEQFAAGLDVGGDVDVAGNLE